MTSKSQLNHHSEPLEIELTGSPTIRELKKDPVRLVGGTESQNELVLHPRVADKNQEDISAEGGPP